MRSLLAPIALTVLAIPLVLATTASVHADGRTFLYGEANMALGYSAESQQVTTSNLPVPTSLGLEFIHSRRGPAKGRVGLKGIDLHLRVSDVPGPQGFDLHFQDAWMLFGTGGTRSQLRVGHFNIPYGMNPVMEPRGIFRMPLEAIDLGFKKDWGFAWQREIGEKHDVEIGAFMGDGGDLHWRRGSFLVATRLGTPAYRNFEYGMSFLVGDLPPTMGNVRMNDMLMRRVRAGLDAVYMWGNYTTFKGEFMAGSDDGRTTVGGLFAVDWIPPRATRWVLALQTEAIKRTMMSQPADIFRIILEATLSLGRLTMARFNVVRTLESPMGTSTELFVLFHYYGR